MCGSLYSWDLIQAEKSGVAPKEASREWLQSGKEVELAPPLEGEITKSSPGGEAMDRSTEKGGWKSRTPSVTQLHSLKKDDPASDPSPVLEGRYLEVFSIGGGTKWLYAFIEFMLQIFVVLKRMGVPFADQVISLW